MKILITGGAGYLGSILTERLLVDHEVTVLDTFEHGVLSLAHLCRSEKLTIIRGDAIDSLDLLLAKADVIIPLAAVVGADACRRRLSEATRVNRDAVSILCDKASSEQIILIPNTNSGYGIGGDLHCDEESRLQPVSAYGALKVEAEERVMHRENAVSFRLATLFGWSPRMRRDLLVNDLVWRAYVDKSAVIFEEKFRRNFCHVVDAARAFSLALSTWPAMRGQIYNVGDTRANATKEGLCRMIKNHLPEFDYRLGGVSKDPDKRDYIVSNAKIEATGWWPSRTLDAGIDELIRGYSMMRKNDYGND